MSKQERELLDLRKTEFIKIEGIRKRKGLPSWSEWEAEKGGRIFLTVYCGRANITRQFEFDEEGELDKIIVEKYLFDKHPESTE